jgi:hypothetical protein
MSTLRDDEILTRGRTEVASETRMDADTTDADDTDTTDTADDVDSTDATDTSDDADTADTDVGPADAPS